MKEREARASHSRLIVAPSYRTTVSLPMAWRAPAVSL